MPSLSTATLPTELPPTRICTTLFGSACPINTTSSPTTTWLTARLHCGGTIVAVAVAVFVGSAVLVGVAVLVAVLVGVAVVVGVRVLVGVTVGSSTITYPGISVWSTWPSLSSC